MKLMNWSQQLTTNIRFYILAAAFLSSIIAVCALRITIPDDRLFTIRIEQVFGFTSAILIYFAVILTPLSKLLANKPWMQTLLFARRGIGVSAAYFASLHTLIALFGQLGGLAGLVLLPLQFKVSIALGVTALLILLLMAATSFDKVITAMTFPRWKVLHRFVYLAGILVIVHVWMIGTHLAQPLFIKVIFVALLVLFLLESLRIGGLIAKKYKLKEELKFTLSMVLFVTMTAALMLLPVLTDNYNARHEGGDEQQQGHGHGGTH